MIGEIETMIEKIEAIETMIEISIEEEIEITIEMIEIDKKGEIEIDSIDPEDNSLKKDKIEVPENPSSSSKYKKSCLLMITSTSSSRYLLLYSGSLLRQSYRTFLQVQMCHC